MLQSPEERADTVYASGTDLKEAKLLIVHVHDAVNLAW